MATKAHGRYYDRKIINLQYSKGMSRTTKVYLYESFTLLALKLF